MTHSTEGYKKSRSFFESVQYAVAGIVYAFRTQRNLRAHVGIGFLVVLVGAQLPLSRAELAVLVLAIGLVVAAELLNTAVELVVDLVADQYHRLAELAKNVAAGAVLAAAVTAAAMGYIVLADHLLPLHPGMWRNESVRPFVAVVVALGIVVVTVLAWKRTRSGLRLRGGMPSLHAAVAGALATSIFILADRGVVAWVGAILALLVAQSRVEGGIHSVAEVLVGGLFGIVAALAAFSVLP